ncbi:hypothetical protein DICVIV_08896, partial [Dictyocaulus viviparus]
DKNKRTGRRWGSSEYEYGIEKKRYGFHIEKYADQYFKIFEPYYIIKKLKAICSLIQTTTSHTKILLYQMIKQDWDITSNSTLYIHLSNTSNNFSNASAATTQITAYEIDRDVDGILNATNTTVNETVYDEHTVGILQPLEISGKKSEIVTDDTLKNQASQSPISKRIFKGLMYARPIPQQLNNPASSSNTTGVHQLVARAPLTFFNSTQSNSTLLSNKNSNVKKAVIHPFESKWRPFFVPLLVLIILLATILIVILLSCIQLMKSHVVAIDVNGDHGKRFFQSRLLRHITQEQESLLHQSTKSADKNVTKNENAMKDSIRSDEKLKKDDTSLERSEAAGNEESFETNERNLSSDVPTPQMRSIRLGKDDYYSKSHRSVRNSRTKESVTGTNDENERLLHSGTQMEYVTPIQTKGDQSSAAQDCMENLNAGHMF